MEDIPCSRVGHIYRKYVPYKVPAGVSLARVRQWLCRGLGAACGSIGAPGGPRLSDCWMIANGKELTESPAWLREGRGAGSMDGLTPLRLRLELC